MADLLKRLVWAISQSRPARLVCGLIRSGGTVGLRFDPIGRDGWQGFRQTEAAASPPRRSARRERGLIGFRPRPMERPKVGGDIAGATDASGCNANVKCALMILS
jgi:hypothetical protein